VLGFIEFPIEKETAMANDPMSGDAQRQAIDRTLAPRLISEPLKSRIEQELSGQAPVTGFAPGDAPYEVIIELNLNNPEGRQTIRKAIIGILVDILSQSGQSAFNQDFGALRRNLDDSTHPYIFATLNGHQILDLVDRDGQRASDNAERLFNSQRADNPGAAPPSRRTMRAIFRIWESQTIHPLTTVSVGTVKANAAHSSFSAFGEGVVWAVLDSGVEKDHPHFELHDNFALRAPLTGKSTSFTPVPMPWDQDAYGHGTHVAGIIAGETDPTKAIPQAAIQSADPAGGGAYHLQPVPSIKGMAPKARLLILRVLNDKGDGDETALIQAIEYVQKLNDYGRHIVVHGVNISAGFPAHPTWYACGQTPLCVEINRLVKSGVAVVVAAGNSGHVITLLGPKSTIEAGQVLSINDPGNAQFAITVGSTHRESPHTFGISYFSSKGPTSDGRRKPDVVAPGEKIVSAASRQTPANGKLAGTVGAFDYIEDSGTSMAAPHVSGVLAAFLSIKREFIGQPEIVKGLLTQSAMDLGRATDFQGAGLVDLMKLIQSV
jgi:serine protease AprX